MHGLHYSYDVRITRGSEILSAGPLSEALPNCGEMVITSRLFDDYQLCEKSLSNLLSNLSMHQAIISDKSHVIVTKINPNHQKPDKPDPEAGDWENSVLLRAYVAEAASLKNEHLLKYNIIGQLKINETDLTLFSAQAPKTLL